MPKPLSAVGSQPSSAQIAREDTLRRLSRSPHPYHRQKVDIAHASENIARRTASDKSPLGSAQATDDEQDNTASAEWTYKESANSDSGTEADDEHFLRGLPAPKLRPRKGLRGIEISASSSPSPLASPGIPDVEIFGAHGFFRRTTIPLSLQKGEERTKAAHIFREKRKIEIIRRATEVGLLVFVAGFHCSDGQVRRLLYLWRKGMCIYCLNRIKTLLTPIRTWLPVSCDRISDSVISNQTDQLCQSHTFDKNTVTFWSSCNIRSGASDISSSSDTTRLPSSQSNDSNWISTQYCPRNLVTSQGIDTFYGRHRWLLYYTMDAVLCTTNCFQ